MSARSDVVTRWDDVLRAWTGGEPDVPAALQDWSRSYVGRGDGRVVFDAFPEPYIGPLAGTSTPALVMLGVNPGAADPNFQGPDGRFTRQVAASGYSSWAATSPYTGPAWEACRGRNRYVQARLGFARRLHRNPHIRPQDMLAMELYPWHSTKVTGSITPPSAVLQEWVWGPLAEVGVPHVFAFGAPWLKVARALGLTERPPLDVTWEVPSRRCAVFQLAGGQDLVVMHHSG